MKKLLPLALMGALIVSCAKETPEPRIDDQTISVSDIDPSQINEDAATFYGNFTTIVNAGKLGKFKPVLTRSGEIDTARLDPITKELAMLDIEDENGNPISFFDMSAQEQELFLQHYETINASELSRKLAVCPEAGFMLKEENEVVARCLEIDATLTPVSSDTNNTFLALNDPDQFFENVHNGMVVAYKERTTELAEGGGSGGSTGGTNPQDTLKVTGREATLVRALHNYGRRGDFMLNIPAGATQYWDDLLGLGALGDLVDFSIGIAMVGHAGVITDGNIKLGADEYDNFTIEATFDEGVVNRYIKSWAGEKSYIMGLQKVKYKRSILWGLFKWGATYTKLNATDAAKLATEAEKYKGYDYCDAWSFWFSKDFASKSSHKQFTCTSLVWWCAREAYDFSLAPWYSTWVTPVQLFRSEHTYIRATIN